MKPLKTHSSRSLRCRRRSLRRNCLHLLPTKPASLILPAVLSFAASPGAEFISLRGEVLRVDMGDTVAERMEALGPVSPGLNGVRMGQCSPIRI